MINFCNVVDIKINGVISTCLREGAIKELHKHKGKKFKVTRYVDGKIRSLTIY